MGNALRDFTFLMGVIVIGSTSPDFDHILPPYTRSWGHSEVVLLVVFLCGLGIAYISRPIKSWFLRRRR